MCKQHKIALSGRAGTGKDTVANMLYELFVSDADERFVRLFTRRFNGIERFTKLSFAEPIKDIISIMFPAINKEYLFGSSEYRKQIIEGTNISIRELLQDIGEHYKKIDPLIWIKALDYKVKNCDSNVIVVSDLRFIQEYNYLKENDFVLIRIIKETNSNMTHVSETQQDSIPNDRFDFIINNNGSLDDLNEEVKCIANQLIMR